MFNAYDYNSKYKSFESQENYSWRVRLLFRVGKGFSDRLLEGSCNYNGLVGGWKSSFFFGGNI